MPVSNRFTILYGSETGQAKAIAEEIHENSSQNGFQSKLFCLSLTEKKFRLEEEPVVVFVASTTGEGDPPDTMQKFFRRLKKKTLPGNHLENTKYALLALGDTNYTNFCVNGKNLDRRLQALGAKKYYDTGHADDAVGLEIVVEPWIEGLWDAIKKCLGLAQGEKGEDKEIIKPSPSEVSINGIANGNCETDIQITNESNALVNGSHKNNAEEEKASVKEEHKDDIIPNGLESKASGHTENNEDGGLSTEECKPSLCKSVPLLAACSLSVPLLPPPYLEIEFQHGQTIDCSTIPHQAGTSFPGAASSVAMATVVTANQLTTSGAVKTALDIELDITGCGFEYAAGDAFNVYCPNDDTEVDELVDRLGLASVADVPFDVKVMESTKKKVVSRPSYIPQLCNIKHALLTCLEIRAVPKKAFLRMLVEYTTDPAEKRRLQELCSKQGSDDYHKYIRESSISLLELLKAFPSCSPPFERLLEHLPRLNPRPYSVASSPMINSNHLHFVFNVVEFPEVENIRKNRQGVCTGWLNKLTSHLRSEMKTDKNGDIAEQISKMDLKETNNVKVAISARKNSDFHLPTDHRVPIIMIGPGTGVAPFIGFLEQREKERADGVDTSLFGETWLFFGCRNEDKDYLYHEKLESFVSNGTLAHLVTSFSRDGGAESSPCYVQDNLKIHANEVATLVLNGGAVVYICGDARNMARNVFDCFCEMIEVHLSIGKMDAIKEMARLRKERKYREDIWT